MVNAPMSDMSTSPLVNLIQAIHLPSHKFLLTTSPSESSTSKITLHLFAHTPKSDGSRVGSETGSPASAGGTGTSSGNAGGSSNGNAIGYGADGNRLPSIIVWEGELDLKAQEVGPAFETYGYMGGGISKD